MLVYLDNCTIQRPLDDRSHVRIAVEAECVLGLIAQVESRSIDIVSSEALRFEIENSTDLFRRSYALQVLARATRSVEVSSSVERRAAEIESRGIKPLDALHVACAEAANAEYLCTCDDDLLRKTRTIEGLRVKVVAPMEIVEELER